jgi:gliding motility-associated-like protein
LKLKSLIVALLLLVFLPSSNATHIVGGELYYQCLGGNDYLITLKVYRDCSSNNTNNTQFDFQAGITIFNSAGATMATMQLQLPPVNNIPVVTSNPCLASPPNICVEEAIYSGTVTLPAIQGGYDIVYQRCCRNPSTVNLQNSQSLGITLTSQIPDLTQAACNSSPSYNNYPPLVLCNGDNFSFDHSANDIDGDSLVYELCTPYHGASNTNPAPFPGSPPPFTYVTWASGYSASNPINGSPGLTIDPNTGMMGGTPTTNGQFVVGVCVKEYRNGIFLGQTVRDFQFTVTNCVQNIVAAIPNQVTFCAGYTITFQNNSQGAISHHWDFGVPNTLADTSNQFGPTFTFPTSGTYTVMLIANPGWTCADTAYTTVEISPPLIASFDPVAGQCITGNSFDFNPVGNFGNTGDFYWYFGPDATPTTSTEEFPSNITYSDSGHHVVSLTVSDFGCNTTYTDTVVVFPEPTIDFIYPQQIGCQPYRVQFTDSSLAWTDISYLWDFGDGNSSTEQNPMHTYEDVGTFDVTLTIQTDSGCVSTLTFPQDDIIVVRPSPTANFIATPIETSIYNPFVTVSDMSIDSDLHQFFMGDGFSTEDRFVEHTYSDTGFFNVMQVVENEFGCTDTMIVSVYIEPEFTLFAPNAFTPNGDGLNEIFKPEVFGAVEYEFLVFDRWGQIIFQTTDPKAGWNGKLQGKDSPIGTYVFKIALIDFNKERYFKTGSFTLIR